MTMPFGKYRGLPLREVPTDYLDWASGVVESRALCAAIREELWSRLYRGSNEPQTTSVVISFPQQDKDLLAEIVENGYKATAKKHHPDRGGDARLMQRLNGVADLLRQQIGALA